MRTIEEIDTEFDEVKAKCEAYLRDLESEHSIEEMHDLIDKAKALADRLAELNEEREETILHHLDQNLTDVLQSAINAVFGVKP